MNKKLDVLGIDAKCIVELMRADIVTICTYLYYAWMPQLCGEQSGHDRTMILQDQSAVILITNGICIYSISRPLRGIKRRTSLQSITRGKDSQRSMENSITINTELVKPFLSLKYPANAVQISQPQAAHCYIGNAVQNKCKDFIA
jgi:hypothetical protein